MVVDKLFPEDILYNIFSRLPIKSLARFRCVCKLWFKYINQYPYLRTVHIVKEEEPPAPLMLEQYSSFAHPNNISTIKFSFLRGTTTSLQKDVVLEFSYKNPYQEIHFLGSCNGQILICYEQDPYVACTYRFAVINPLTKQRHNLPPISVEVRHPDVPWDAAGIGFDDSTNTFKTVFSYLKNPNCNVVCTMVHSSGTRSWRKIAQKPACPIRGAGVFSDGCLYWVAAFGDHNAVKNIVWFDVKTEEFGLPLDPPEGSHPEGWYRDTCYHQLVDLNGEVGYAYIGIPYCIKLWILLKHEGWVSHCSIDVRPILAMYRGYNYEVSGCWNKAGDILFTKNRGGLLFVYSLKTGDLQKVELRDQCEGFTGIRMYESTLFSFYARSYS